MHGLDVTHQALVTPARLAAIRALGTPVSAAVTGLLEFYSIYDQTKRGRPGPPLHDPCTIAWLLRPELFQGRACHVAIETEGQHTLGRTVVDWSGRTEEPRQRHGDRPDRRRRLLRPSHRTPRPPPPRLNSWRATDSESRSQFWTHPKIGLIAESSESTIPCRQARMFVFAWFDRPTSPLIGQIQRVVVVPGRGRLMPGLVDELWCRIGRHARDRAEGRATLRTAWIDRTGSDVPELVTLHVR